MKEITSAQNGQIKLIRSIIADKKSRFVHGLFVAEGSNLIKDMGDKSGALFVRMGDLQKHGGIIDQWQGEISLVSDGVFDSVADTVNSNGVLALAAIPRSQPLSGALVLVMDGIADPGNAGTIIRTACAMGIKDIIGIDTVDFYNPKTVRASMGGVFLANLVAASGGFVDSIARDYSIAVLDMSGKDVYHYKPPPKLALVVGGEARGVSQAFRQCADAVLAVPMYGKIESLNAAVSVSIALSVLTHNQIR